MIYLNPQKFWAKMFNWSRQYNYEFVNIDYCTLNPKTNACIIFWSLMTTLLILTIQGFAIGIALFSFVIYPIMVFGGAYLTVLSFIAAIIFGVVILGAIIYAFSILGSFLWNAIVDSKAMDSFLEKESETCILVGSWYQSWKEKTCILITIGDPNEK